ncbi:MAG: hypothetical protein KAX49_20440, partial [Halanaerobiales bacterium]|nr:hypothetical protein [Halanaerobiales bacterium]
SEHLNSDFNYWGINADQTEGVSLQNIRIETIAEKYMEQIRKLQPEGPYYVVGWSLGGTIAFEIINQLEKMNENIQFFGMIDSMAPQKKILSKVKEFTLKSELKWVKANFAEIKVNGVITIEELWNSVERQLAERNDGVQVIKSSLPVNLAMAIPNYEEAGVKELLYYLNKIRSFNLAHRLYAPESKINTQVNFFKASKTDQRMIKNWSQYCINEVSICKITGDHFSIFRLPDVEELARVFDDILAELLL